MATPERCYGETQTIVYRINQELEAERGFGVPRQKQGAENVEIETFAWAGFRCIQAVPMWIDRVGAVLGTRWPWGCQKELRKL